MTFDKNKIKSLGDIGEKIAIAHYSALGHKVVPSFNPYDSQKDLLVNGKRYEVKTQQPHVKLKSLTFKPNQLPKCGNTETQLVFVTAESSFSPTYKWNNCFFEVDSNFEYFPYKTNDDVDMIAIPIDQPAVRFIKKLDKDAAYELKKQAQSNYKNGKRKY